MVERLEIGDLPVTVVERRWVAYHLDAGHVLAFWPSEGRFFAISVHGFENRDTLLGMVEATIATMQECEEDPPEDLWQCGSVYPAGGGD